MTIHLLKYNNYYNRIIKGSSRLADYPAAIYTLNTTNFKPNDGISTSIPVNTGRNDVDYLLVCEGSEILSRWFILESVRNREGQHILQLRRDLVYDKLDEIKVAPMFIEKAKPRINNSLIFNSENMTYNQIKTEERLLKDELGCPWIVGYIKKSVQDKTITIPANPLDVDYTLDNIDQYMFYSYTETPAYTEPRDHLLLTKFWYEDLFTLNTYYQTGVTLSGQASGPLEGGKPAFGINLYSTFQGGGRRGYKSTEQPITTATDITRELNTDTNWTTYQSILDESFAEGPLTVEQLKKEDGKVISVGNTYYRIKVDYLESEVREIEIAASSQLGIEMNNHILDAGVTGPDTPALTAQARVTPLVLRLQETTVDSFILNIGSNRRSLPNQPYDIFAMPVGEFKMYPRFSDITLVSAIIPDLPYRIAAAISSALGEELLDLQLLPYAPINPVYLSPGELYVYDLIREPAEGQKQDYTYFLKGSSINGVLFWIGKESFTAEISEFGIDAASTVEDLKVQSETEVCRIVSPNYNGVFEINPAKNRGLKNFRADCTLRPYSPYIRVYPEFGGLYGDNFGDARGLICGGDFSLPRTTQDWITYEQNNKNYQRAFDRQIENLEFNNNLASMEQGISSTLSALSAGATTGVLAGSALGPAGAAVGAGAGALSGMFGAVDLYILAQRQAEVLDFTKDNFGYTLGNIKARPYNINKLSAFDINNKIWPFLEIFKCTPEEEYALRQKLKYNGYTIGCVGTLEEYMTDSEDYIKGKLIRLDIGEDYHFALEIAEELNKGVYI